MEKVLVLEDRFVNLKLIKYSLERFCYKVIAATNGLSGAERAMKLKPFFIIIDINLPTHDGILAINKIRSIIGFENIPIISITSNAILGNREKAMQAGCIGYFEKPIDPITIMDEIHKLFGINL
jgi:two-component system, cell cycle response regulator DivK